jgi:hypothetical protein
MRILILSAVAAAALIAAPAAAQHSRADATGADVAEALPHPYEVEEMGDRIGVAADALANVPIGDLARAIDPAADLPPDATVADVMGRGDPAYRDSWHDQITAMSLKLADVLRGVSAATPEISARVAEMERVLDRTIAALPPVYRD